MKYKVGDKVRIKSIDWYNENKDNYGAIYAGNGFCFWKNMARHCGEIMKITIVKVDPLDSNKGYYFMENSEERWTDEMIEGLDKEVKTESIVANAIAGEIIAEKMMLDIILAKGLLLPKDYVFKDENGSIINASKIVLEKKKPKYPTTYEECCKIIGDVRAACWGGYKCDILGYLNKLLICRDAYWKIAGEEMGLGKSWEPDWKVYDKKYAIGMHEDMIYQDTETRNNKILAFPTAEMRDAFYENFKELINECKELL